MHDGPTTPTPPALPGPQRRPGPSGLRVRILVPGDPTLDDLGHILEDRFPADERDDWAHLVALHAAGKMVLAAAEDHAVSDVPQVPAQSVPSAPRVSRQRAVPRVCGVAVIALLPRTESAALLYLATARDAPSAGVGLQLMAYLHEHLPGYGIRRGFIGEIERVEDAKDALDVVVRRRRIRYYERFGGRALPGLPGYGMPDMANGGLLPMGLMWLPWDTAVAEVTAPLLHALVTELYEVAYDRTADDPLLAQVLASARVRPPVPASTSAPRPGRAGGGDGS